MEKGSTARARRAINLHNPSPNPPPPPGGGLSDLAPSAMAAAAAAAAAAAGGSGGKDQKIHNLYILQCYVPVFCPDFDGDLSE